jgi:hypothetical protein
MYLKDGGYWHFCPGHGTREQVFTVRPKAGGWDVYQNNQNISELRVSNAGLYERFTGQTNWSWHPRMYNIWRLWIAGALSSKKSESYPMRVAVASNLTAPNGRYAEMQLQPTTQIQVSPPNTNSSLIVTQQCMRNLKQIVLSFMHWANNHNGEYPFNVSTNSGGSKELCSPAADGFESHPEVQFQFLSEDGPPLANLVCPADTNRQAAVSFQLLTHLNITYQLRCCTNSTKGILPAVLARCPIHGLLLYSDGSILNTQGN